MFKYINVHVRAHVYLDHYRIMITQITCMQMMSHYQFFTSRLDWVPICCSKLYKKGTVWKQAKWLIRLALS